SSFVTNTNQRVETAIVYNPSNSIVSKVVNTYQAFPWGEEQIKQVVDPNGAALTTTWSYYTNSVTDAVSYMHLKEMVRPNGYWERYEYDSMERETKRVSQFQNTALGSAENANRVVTTTYASGDPAITSIEKLLGQEVSRRYTVYVGTSETR